ncbi:aspartyl protease family protein [Novosphingobium sp. 1748]|uniref:aspartyl protease family protein n=2 Tax=Novosphingobium TaxID=165696 RepID=UPI00286CE58B|nr:aspartyl protease family protein [Novosphingobium sp. 1748]
MRLRDSMACGLFCALTIVSPAAAECRLGRVAQLAVTMEGRLATVPITVNGKQTRFALDSGAFLNVMSQARAKELGLPLQAAPSEFTVVGVGGAAVPQKTTIKSFGIAGVDIKNVGFLVVGNSLDTGYIGLNLLASFDTEYDLANGNVNLFAPKECENTNLAYWARDKAVSVIDWLPGDYSNDKHLYVQVRINGKTMRAMLDTGASISTLNRTAAEKAGLDLSDSSAQPDEAITGIGSKARRSWNVRLASFGIGGEEIRNATIRVMDAGFDPLSDMVLGADFFLAHHVLASYTQRLIYLTYNGGPVFSLDNPASAGGARPAEDIDTLAGEPDDADAYARRGAARLTRGDSVGAIGDLTQAIRKKPDTANYHYMRATAHLARHDAAAAAVDFDSAVKLAPTESRFLIARSFNRLSQNDKTGALADAEAASALIPAGSLENLKLVALFDQLQKPERSLKMLDEVIRLHAEDPLLGELLNARCWTRGAANVELDMAMADCAKAIRRDGARPSYLDSRALIYLRQKNYPAAIADYDAALAQQPGLASSLYMRGWARQAIGQNEAGAEDMANARKQTPDIADKFARYGFNTKS